MFKPFTCKGLSLPNRVVMAPMTRSQSPGGVPTAAVADYYARRAAADVGLIITEGTVINRGGASNDPISPNFTAIKPLRAGSAVRNMCIRQAVNSRRKSGIWD